MRRAQFIGMDVHCQETEIAVLTRPGRLIQRMRVPTTIPTLVEALSSLGQAGDVVLEEGPLADWLYRNLSGYADRVTVCDPRRNHLIAKDSDKDDPIDAEKLARLYRGGYVKAVHHPQSFERAVFKQQVGLYHDRVRNRVRQANRIMAQLRRHGVFVHERAFAEPGSRSEVLARLPKSRILRLQIQCLWYGYDVAAEQVRAMRAVLVRLARKEPQIRRFTQIPGIHWVRGATFFVYVDTPWRFKSKSALWKYLGIGLERSHSGSGPERVQLPRMVNHCLKSTILGAAKSAIAAGSNPFADQYERWLDAGLGLRKARRNVARSQAAVLWGMWKNGEAYRPEWVGVRAAVEAGSESSRDRESA
jgi:transposase